VQIFLEDTQPKISEMVADASHVVYWPARRRKKVDRVFTKLPTGCAGQLVRADHILTGAWKPWEDAGSKFSHSVGVQCTKCLLWCRGLK